MAAPVPPSKGMTVIVPVGRGLVDSRAKVLPGFEAPTFQGERAQDLPPWFNQVQIGGIDGLKDELPAWVCKGEEQDVCCPMGAQVVENDKNTLGLCDMSQQPRLYLFEKVGQVRSRATGIGCGLGKPCRGQEGAKDVPFATPPMVNLLLRTRGRFTVVFDKQKSRQMIMRNRGSCDGWQEL